MADRRFTGPRPQQQSSGVQITRVFADQLGFEEKTPIGSGQPGCGMPKPSKAYVAKSLYSGPFYLTVEYKTTPFANVACTVYSQNAGISTQCYVQGSRAGMGGTNTIQIPIQSSLEEILGGVVLQLEANLFGLVNLGKSESVQAMWLTHGFF